MKAFCIEMCLCYTTNRNYCYFCWHRKLKKILFQSITPLDLFLFPISIYLKLINLNTYGKTLSKHNILGVTLQVRNSLPCLPISCNVKYVWNCSIATFFFVEFRRNEMIFIFSTQTNVYWVYFVVLPMCKRKV